MSAVLILAPPNNSRLRFLNSSGKNFGSAPNTTWPPFSSSRETPMAVISAVKREYLRTGR